MDELQQLCTKKTPCLTCETDISVNIPCGFPTFHILTVTQENSSSD